MIKEYISILLNVSKLVLWSISVNVPFTLVKKSAFCCCWVEYSMNVNINLIVLFRSSISLLIGGVVYLFYYCERSNEISNYNCEFISIFFNFIRFCFMYLEAVNKAYTSRIATSWFSAIWFYVFCVVLFMFLLLGFCCAPSACELKVSIKFEIFSTIISSELFLSPSLLALQLHMC